MRSSNRRQSLGLQGTSHQGKEVGKDLLATCIRRDERDHEVALIGIDTPSSTLALDDSDAMRAAVVLVHLKLCGLMTAIDDRRRHDPREERWFGDALQHILLYLKILRQRQSLIKSQELQFLYLDRNDGSAGDHRPNRYTAPDDAG